MHEIENSYMLHLHEKEINVVFFALCQINLHAFNTTVKLLSVIANAANIGFIVTPNPLNNPIAIGIIQIL